jgi:glycerol dehydrogenase-like iron-containing ADH family enzyme
MFAVKIFSKKRRKNNILERTIQNLSDFLKKQMNQNVNIVSDNNSIEMVSGNLDTNNGEIVTELMFKKTIILNTDDLNDKQKLDKYVREIKHFCEQASSIEDLKYLPLHYREYEK